MAAGTVLRGTPVVSGVAHAPAVVVSTEIDPDGARCLRGQRAPDEAEALAAYDAAVVTVADS